MVPAVLSDQALLAAVGAGSRLALFELYNRHGAAVHHLGGLVAGDDDADRVVEEMFVARGRAGCLEDGTANVRLGLLAMAGRRALAGTTPDDARDAAAATMMADASLTDVAGVFRISRRVAAHRLHSGLAVVGTRREGFD